MTSGRIERNVLIDAPMKVVWDAISQHRQIAEWFSDEAEFDLRPGGEGLLTFSTRASNRPSDYPIRFEVVEPPRTLGYRWLHPKGGDPRPENSLLVEFLLGEEHGKTRVTVVESGLDGIAWSETEKASYLASHGSGWERHLENLSAYVSTADRQPVEN